MTSPMNSSGVMTSNSMTGSSSTGSALRAASFSAIEPAILNAISRGVDLVVDAVDQRGPDVHHRVAGQDAVVERLLDALVDGGDVLARDLAADDLVR